MDNNKGETKTETFQQYSTSCMLRIALTWCVSVLDIPFTMLRNLCVSVLRKCYADFCLWPTVCMNCQVTARNSRYIFYHQCKNS